MYERKAGWISIPVRNGYLTHYFKENQPISLCGVSFGNMIVPAPIPPTYIPTCLRCHKFYENHGLGEKTVVVKNKH